MPTVKELKKQIRDYKKQHCPAYSKLKKAELQNYVNKVVKKKPRRVALTQVAGAPSSGTLRNKASAGQKTTAGRLKEMEKRIRKQGGKDTAKDLAF